MLVFVPLAEAALRRLATGESTPAAVRAYAAGDGVRAALGYPADWEEETERAVLLFASVDALAEHGRRLVAVAEAGSPRPGTDPDLGQVVLDGLAWAQVSAVFADGPQASAAVAGAAKAAQGLNLDDAWELPEVERLVADHDLLWFGPSELEQLLADN